MMVHNQLALRENRRSSASASGRDDRYGSNTTIASRAAWKNKHHHQRRGQKRAPAGRAQRSQRPRQKRECGHRQRQRKYANDASVRSSMWLSDSV
jgi:hypothetical protein